MIIALGNFDGVHLGHQKLIRSAGDAVITFDPHPQQFIVPDRGLKLLTTLEERKTLFHALGVDRVIVIKFDRKLQQLSYEDFVKKILVNRLHIKQVCVGFDYAFGKGRGGDVTYLKQLGKKYGFRVRVVAPVRKDGVVVKSKIIRELISAGEFTRAVRLLGHPYQITGKVVKGSGRGKGLGFPTANLQVDRHKLIPAQGVYAGVVGGKKCVVNIGARPTFGAGQTVIEVHILRFNKNIRGRVLKVLLTKRLREERQFSDVQALKKQIGRDIAAVQRL